MTLVDILIILLILGIAFVAVRYVLGLMGIAVPDPLVIMVFLLILLLVLTGQCDIRLGIGGR